MRGEGREGGRESEESETVTTTSYLRICWAQRARASEEASEGRVFEFLGRACAITQPSSAVPWGDADRACAKTNGRVSVHGTWQAVAPWGKFSHALRMQPCDIWAPKACTHPPMGLTFLRKRSVSATNSPGSGQKPGASHAAEKLLTRCRGAGFGEPPLPPCMWGRRARAMSHANFIAPQCPSRAGPKRFGASGIGRAGDRFPDPPTPPPHAPEQSLGGPAEHGRIAPTVFLTQSQSLELPMVLPGLSSASHVSIW